MACWLERSEGRCPEEGRPLRCPGVRDLLDMVSGRVELALDPHVANELRHC